MSTFVDSGAWYAIFVPADPQHQKITSWLRANPVPLFTSDYVVDETLTLFRARGQHLRAIEFGRSAFDLNTIAVHFLELSDLRRAWEVFRALPARNWSFTDCTSKAIIEKFHTHRALTFDKHFTEFAALEILP
jgi:hypothetical protein